MLATIRPNPELRKIIVRLAQAEINLCYVCGSCIPECPINLATIRLSPRKIVWMANLGLLDELLHLPEIWYCLTCNRCNQICPMTVKPANLIGYLQWEARCRQLVTEETIRRYKTLCSELHRIRWHLVSQCLSDRITSLNGATWRQLLEAPVTALKGAMFLNGLSSNSKAFKKATENYIGDPTNVALCFSCGSCSSVCPVFSDRNIFDPLWILRMTILGLQKDILESPSIWLCIACQKCTNACSQRVRCHLIIRRLQELALEEGFVDKDFFHRWQEIQKTLYTLFLEKIDSLFNFQQSETEKQVEKVIFSRPHKTPIDHRQKPLTGCRQL